MLEKRGRTLYWLAGAIGTPYLTLWKIEKKAKEGRSQESINLDLLGRMCAALDCSPNDLLEVVPDDESKAMVLLIQTRDKKTAPATKEGKPTRKAKKT